MIEATAKQIKDLARREMMSCLMYRIKTRLSQSARAKMLPDLKALHMRVTLAMVKEFRRLENYFGFAPGTFDLPEVEGTPCE